MARETDAVFEAIDRWERNGLVSSSLADSLRAEAASAARVGARTASRYILASAGALVLLISGGLFLGLTWPLLAEGGRTSLLAVTALLLLLLGTRLERAPRWRPASYLLQTAALGLLLFSFGYSKRAWEDVSVGGIVVGALSLATPLVMVPRAMRRSVVMPAIHLAMGLAFFAMFLDRATPLDADGIVWVLDGVLALAILGLLRLLREDPSGDRYPWALYAFAMAMAAGFVLLGFTGVGPLHMGSSAAYALDVWWALNVGLTLWGLDRSGVGPRRAALSRLLANLFLLWIPLGFYTALEAVDGPPELALLLVSGMGIGAFLFAEPRGFRDSMSVGGLAFVSGLWYWGVERGGAWGAILALAATAALLFWISGRRGEAEGR